VRCVLRGRQLAAAIAVAAEPAAIAAPAAVPVPAAAEAGAIMPARLGSRRPILCVLWRGRLDIRAGLTFCRLCGSGDSGWFQCSRLARNGSRKYLAALFLHLLHFLFDGRDDLVVLLDSFEEVADVEEGVAIEADIHKGRLHAGQHASDTAFVNAAN
jgi:hypothetical protein